MLRLKILTSCRPSCLLAVPLKAKTAVPPSSQPTCTCTPPKACLHTLLSETKQILLLPSSVCLYMHLHTKEGVWVHDPGRNPENKACAAGRVQLLHTSAQTIILCHRLVQSHAHADSHRSDVTSPVRNVIAKC